MPVKIFFCYAHEDEPLLNKLKSQLSPLLRQGLIEMWHDRNISAGTKWEEEIDKHLNEANIILLLISPDFINSDYCYGKEMKRALERDKRREARIIPVILRPVYWQGVLGTLQALPNDGKPVMSSSWPNQEEAFFNISEGIRKIVVPPSTTLQLETTMSKDIERKACQLGQHLQAFHLLMSDLARHPDKDTSAQAKAVHAMLQDDFNRLHIDAKLPFPATKDEIMTLYVSVLSELIMEIGRELESRYSARVSSIFFFSTEVASYVIRSMADPDSPQLDALKPGIRQEARNLKIEPSIIESFLKKPDLEKGKALTDVFLQE